MVTHVVNTNVFKEIYIRAEDHDSLERNNMLVEILSNYNLPTQNAPKSPLFLIVITLEREGGGGICSLDRFPKHET